jgi:hypothetical protein
MVQCNLVLHIEVQLFNVTHTILSGQRFGPFVNDMAFHVHFPEAGQGADKSGDLRERILEHVSALNRL